MMTRTASNAEELADPCSVDIAIEAESWGDAAALREVCEAALRRSFQVAGLHPVPNSEISLVFTDDASIQELNKRWRDKDKPTNVLSFPGSDPDGEVYGPLLGDIVFAYETVRREAVDMEIDFKDHLTHLMVHGVLHLFDYDHQDDDEAKAMEQLEQRILAELGVADPYQDAPLVSDRD